ncbi:MAG TPA: cytochrome c [Gammaproteobacteria bacterium]|nr:cytochrome c [Gammaproteobacteria bacterium]
MMRILGFAMVSLSVVGPGLAWADAGQEAQGQQVYAHWCEPCHGDGPNFPGTTALRAKYEGKIEPVLARRGDLTADFIKVNVRKGVSVMPFFRKTEISDPDLEALAAYLSRH